MEWLSSISLFFPLALYYEVWHFNFIYTRELHRKHADGSDFGLKTTSLSQSMFNSLKYTKVLQYIMALFNFVLL